MRVMGDGIQTVAEEVEITFDGETLKAYEGETVAASLTAAGKLGLRETKDGSKRGIFCGMGVCNECLVSIDGQQNIRAYRCVFFHLFKLFWREFAWMK